MNLKSDITMENQLTASGIFSWLFGILVFAIGLLNLFWGNDAGFGAFLVLLSCLYFPPVTDLLKKWTGISIHYLVKVVLGILILWAALGVGELFEKIELMQSSF